MVLAAGPQVAAAATATTTFQVTASVNAACQVSATDLAFGVYGQTPGVDTDSTSTVTVNCTLLVPYDIGLSAGTGPGATVSNRVMTSGTDELNYSLYTTALRTTVWGDTVDTDTVSGIGTGLGQPAVVYGRVFADQSDTAPSGSYEDTVTATVTF